MASFKLKKWENRADIPEVEVTFPDGHEDCLVLQRYYSHEGDRRAGKLNCNFIGRLKKDTPCRTTAVFLWRQFSFCVILLTGYAIIRDRHVSRATVEHSLIEVRSRNCLLIFSAKSAKVNILMRVLISSQNAQNNAF